MRIEGFMTKYNDEHKIGKLDLVMFEDALGHLMRISRVLGTRAPSDSIFSPPQCLWVFQPLWIVSAGLNALAGGRAFRHQVGRRIAKRKS